MRNRVTPVRLSAVAMAAAMTIAACGSDDAETATDEAGDDATPAAGTESDDSTDGDDSDDGAVVEVTGQWARTSPANAEAGAAYMTLSAAEETVIVGASVSADIAGTVELHETVPVDDAMDDSHDDDAMDDEAMDDSHADMAMTMRPMSEIVIPAGGSVEMAPGGMHVMLLDLAAPLEAGQTFELTLATDTGDEIIVDVEVRDEAP